MHSALRASIATLGAASVSLAAACEAVESDPYLALPDWRLDSVAELSVGQRAGTEEYLFASIRDAAILPDGGVAILDSRLDELRIFDSTGGFVALAGRTGEGPGELSNPADLELIGEKLVVWDKARVLVIRWNLDGTLSDERRPPSHRAFDHGFMAPDGSLVIPQYVGGGQMQTGHYSEPYELLWYIGEDTVNLGDYFPFGETFGTADGIAGVPFGALSVAAAGGEPVRVFIGEARSGIVRELGPDGEELGRLSLIDRREPVTDEVWQTRLPSDDRPDVAIRRRRYERMTRPDSTRWFEALKVDEAGRLWVLSRDLAGDAFAIVYRDNAAVAMIDLPDSARVLDIDADLIALLEADEMGVQAVAVYRYGPR